MVKNGKSIYTDVLVTGAAGLIGSKIVQKLLLKNINVIACDNSIPQEPNIENERIKWLRLDISDQKLKNRLDEFQIDAVIHCAAHPGGLSLKEPANNVRINVFGSMQLFEWCSVKKIPILYLSSSVVYGSNNKGEPIKETDPVDPQTIYAVGKIACENYLQVLEKGYGLNWKVVRVFATYGVGHKPSLDQGIVNVMYTQLSKGNSVIVKGSVNRIRDMVYVNDTAEAILQCFFSPDTNKKIINIGSGSSYTIREMIETLIKEMGKEKDTIQIIEEKGTVGDPFYNVPDISLLLRLTSFVPQFDLQKGLSTFITEKQNITY